MTAPLAGRRIVVTRPRDQSEGLAAALRGLGADVVAAPAIRIEPPEDWRPLDEAIERIDDYDWILFTSANGVRFFLERLARHGVRPGAWRARLAAIGPATARALDERGLAVALMPERFVAESFFEALDRQGSIEASRILLPRADIARETLPAALRGRGARVDVVVAYRTRTASDELRPVVDRIPRGEIDVVTFTSGSTVRSFFAVADAEALRGRFLPASIGPITSAALRREGMPPAIEATRYTTEGLVEAIVAHFRAAAPPGVRPAAPRS